MRLKRHKKIGLALGSGVARGLAHIGVLEVLERENIPVDVVAGTSIGSIVGALYAMGTTSGEMIEKAREVGPKRLNLFTDFTLPKTGLVKGRRIEEILKSYYGDMKIENLKMPFACVATDIDSGEEVIMKQGSLWRSVRASISLPVILAVTELDGRYLVDGYLVNPVPVNVCRELGADAVIAVNVIPDRNVKTETEPNILDIVMQTLHIVGYYAIQSSVAGADVLINPDVHNISYTDFHRVDEGVRAGREAAEKALPAIKKMLAG
jgi:NTE family protein